MSIIASLLPFVVVGLAFALLNKFIAKRKGKDETNYFWLSFIPLVSQLLTFYLLSFLDKEVEDKINHIYDKLNQ